jgi:hypothetical protein
VRQWWLVLVLAGSGCNSLLGIDELTPIDASGSDEIDAAPIDSPPGSICAMLVDPVICFTPLPTDPIMIEGVNTDTDPRCVVSTQNGGSSICAILGGTITIPATGAIISGARPLLLVATTTITVDGILDASSEDGTSRIGPGANPVPGQCGPALSAGGGNDGGGGGAGGSFSTKGGNGGKGGGNGGSNGVLAADPQVPTILRAGCRGSEGGRNGGPGGFGGGAIYLVAGTSIAITARVTANGAGGTGATNNESAGGGGGAGGMIVVEAPAISLAGTTAELSANGGGGGEGTVSTDAGEGGESAAWDMAATGGTGGSTNGGDGGTGATGTAAAAVGGLGIAGGEGNDGGGGGGGGGGGVIWIKGPAPTGAQMNQISPAPILMN